MDILSPPKTAKGRFKNNFLTGLVAMLPVGLTAYLCWLLFKWSGRLFGELLIYIPYLQTLPQIARWGIGFILLVGLIYLVGLLASHLLGRRLLKFWENVLTKIPLVRIIYGTTRQFTDNFFTNKYAFREVVAVEYPRPGTYALGFLTSEVLWDMEEDQKGYSVYLPNTPNPTGGRVMIVPLKRLFRISITVEEAIKLIVSGGMVSPQGLKILASLDQDA
ncbi:MAG: DUF502 domain-containing protein [Candidatus Edwardsbacteria bacterium]|nr:DUF502 domain-containing protein [Candidatus Edwardsbacteria bacterium]MBU1577676.1 DUF502 domain-containing protein [Candidatus Edwardsbacteria bacterium]MBU2463352.1 DUF502 domain-containing protein [Candidatus Edwardsbacteria bacterium]MBU2594573.1 DUF502 domain-containing protein [Candidatus Edwardsbacteria bacterium]